MKHSLYLSISAIIGLSACSNQLDVRPDHLASPSMINSNNLALVVNGAKLGLTNNAFNLYYSLTEIMGDDVQTLAYAGYESCNVPVAENALQFAYRYPYQCVGNANAAIHYWEAHKDESALRPIAGEAYLLRGYAYSLLNEQFGQVALMKGGEDPLTFPLRESEDKVKAFVEADLRQAVELLPDFTSGVTKASKQAAQLLLARHCLNNGKYKDAVDMAEAVINSGKFSLADKVDSAMFLYNTSSREMIYAIGEASNSGSKMLGLNSVFGAGGFAPWGGEQLAGNGNTWIDEALINTYEDTDVRKKWYFKRKGLTFDLEVNYLNKFPMEATPSYPVCRLAEAYLIAAEGKARQGNVDVTHFNTLRGKRKASLRTTGDFASAQAFLDMIESERRREFTGERLRWSDMRRFGKALPWLSSLQQPGGHVLLPLPERLLVLNPNIKQNSDY
ncbi:RagB/SusD family nutrient uptake outer membrane protein [Chitinophaga sp. NPDC101104]|uniref:RagB/SusD family nutrient uptake outer membrane protein n=1 Tax=Chitinophaga sp. NPDC101104 TaxID=3390561 RepID=UPI003D055C5A